MRWLFLDDPEINRNFIRKAVLHGNTTAILRTFGSSFDNAGKEQSVTEGRGVRVKS